MIAFAFLASFLTIGQSPAETTWSVDPSRVVHRLSPYLYGACIEDVNHEIYGGISSQMLFGESFQEPPPSVPPRGFTAYGGQWKVADGELEASAGDGFKVVSEAAAIGDGQASVEIFFPDDRPGNAALILKLDRPGVGADKFTGYEVALESPGRLMIGRHRQNWEPILTVPCPVGAGRWVKLDVRMTGRALDVRIDGRLIVTYEDSDHPLPSGRVALRTWQRAARFRNLRFGPPGSVHAIPLEPASDLDRAEATVSGMWRPTRTGSARGEFGLTNSAPFTGRQSQTLAFLKGEGQVGLENRGLNRWGLNVVAGKPYEGRLWARAEGATEVIVGFENASGEEIATPVKLQVLGDWARYDFRLEPTKSDRAARFAIKLDRPGRVDLGHAFLQPGEWGRYKGLPVRKDVAEGLLGTGLTVLRYGGSMINHPEYRWKKMVGPRDRRPPSPGTWYPYSSNGWGIFDFLDFCEAAGILGFPAVFMGESPEDMADFIEYVNGPPDSPWGQRRVRDGHPQPYRLRHLELGNEEAVNDDYWRKFQPMAEAIWARDPNITLVVGDFAYNQVITDPMRFSGGVAASSLAAHRKILELARQRGREVWFDIHVSTDHPPEPNGLKPERSYIDQLGRLAPGAKFKVVIFEYNSGNHAQRRALSNALATLEVERIGDRVPVACAANALQPDGQNDNGWDQGLVFLNPSQVWLQPPGYVIRMIRRTAAPLLVSSEWSSPIEGVSGNAKRSEDGKTLVLELINTTDSPRKLAIRLDHVTPRNPLAEVEQLAGPLDAVNTAEQPERIKPEASQWRHGLEQGSGLLSLPPRSFTVIRVE
jgi:hypothetical protein